MKVTIILLLLNILNSMGYSIIAPLFPTLGKRNGLNDGLIGLIISSYSISGFLCTPFIPLMVQKFGRIKLLYISTFFVASCTILYSFLYYISSFYGLIITASIIRVINGCFSGIVFTLVYSLTISLSEKEHTQKTLGYLELGFCFGSSCGPLIASIFYKIGGYRLPFLALGLFLYLSVYLTSKIGEDKNVPNKKGNENKKNLPFFKFFCYWEIIFILGSLIIAVLCGTFYLPSLTNYLVERYGFSVSMASLFFIISIIFYVIFLQFLDLVSKKIGLYGTASLGLFISFLGAFFLSPIIPCINNIYTLIIGFGLLGTGQAPIFIPLLIALSKEIQKIEPGINELVANDIATSVNNVTFSVGKFSGPIIGGYITDALGFNYCCFFISLFILIYYVAFNYYFYQEILNKTRNKGELLNEKINNEINDITNINKLHMSFIIYDKLCFNDNMILNKRQNSADFGRKNHLDKISLYSNLTQ